MVQQHVLPFAEVPFVTGTVTTTLARVLNLNTPKGVVLFLQVALVWAVPFLCSDVSLHPCISINDSANSEREGVGTDPRGN